VISCNSDIFIFEHREGSSYFIDMYADNSKSNIHLYHVYEYYDEPSKCMDRSEFVDLVRGIEIDGEFIWDFFNCESIVKLKLTINEDENEMSNQNKAW
jgi:hypothetical protein